MKEIKFKLGDAVLVGQLGSRVEKKSLYGYSRKVAECDGKILSRGFLSADGRLLRRDEVALVKLDPDGSPVEEVRTEMDGQIAELKPSAFEQENEIRPTALARLATFAVSDVYPLEGLSLDPGLYETQFSFRKSILPKEALLLVKAGGESYLLVGEAKQSTFVGLSVAYSFFDAEDDADEESEDLDFAMV
jgi:hypothetical protein